MQHYVKWIFAALAGLFLVACTNPNSPEGVAKKFWDGVMTQNHTVAAEFSSTETKKNIDFSRNQINWGDMQLSLGTAEISGNQATVHTLLVNKKTTEKYAFNTYLVQENGLWRVDYDKTRKASLTSEIFADLILSLQKFNTALNTNFDDTVAGFREAAPEIKKEIDQLTTTLTNHMNVASSQGNPAVHGKIQQFKDEMMSVFTHHSQTDQTAAPAIPVAPQQ
ncbi:MAG: hypothetical protein ABSF18_05970 [Gammaproteobacteria bacterium]|jgi:hypothetical protein